MTTLVNCTREKLAAGEIAIGAGVRLARTVDIVPAMKTAGFDWLFIDLEHGSLSIDTASQIAVAGLQAGITPIARVPKGEYNMATRLLDNGALGMVIPHVDTANDAKAAVHYLRFPPIGHRSVFGGMPHFDFQNMKIKDLADAINRETLIAVMLETPTAIENATEIAAVPGIDVLFIGINDLCLQMDIPGEFTHPSVRAAYRRTIDACRLHGKWAGMGGVYQTDFMVEQTAAGFQFVLGGTDLGFMMQSGAQKVRDLQQNLRGP